MKSISIKAMIRKTVRQLLLLVLFMVCLPKQLVWSQLPQHSMFLNNEIKFERPGIEKVLANNSVTNLMQDRKGFIWFATNDGLTKYDGYTFTLYQNNLLDTNSLTNNSINAVYEDRPGLILVGTGGGGGVNFFNPETDAQFTNPFMTKPTSQGTGLGLSLSYDIITKEHEEELRVDTAAGEYSEFIITLSRVDRMNIANIL